MVVDRKKRVPKKNSCFVLNKELPCIPPAIYPELLKGYDLKKHLQNLSKENCFLYQRRCRKDFRPSTSHSYEVSSIALVIARRASYSHILVEYNAAVIQIRSHKSFV